MHCPVPINFFILDICLKWRSRTLFASNFYQAKCWKFRDLPVLSVCCLARYETNTWFFPRNKALLLLDLVFDQPGFQMSFFIPKAPLKYILWLWKIFFLLISGQFLIERAGKEIFRNSQFPSFFIQKFHQIRHLVFSDEFTGVLLFDFFHKTSSNYELFNSVYVLGVP